MSTLPDDYPTRSNKDVHFLQVLVGHYCHHDQLFWSRINFVYLLQAAAMGGAWSLRLSSTKLAICIIGFAILLSILWIFIFNRDLQAREENRALLVELAERVRTDLGLEQTFTIGKPIAPLPPFPEVYTGSLMRRVFGLFDSGPFLWVPARSVILMRIALTAVLVADVGAIYYLYTH